MFREKKQRSDNIEERYDSPTQQQKIACRNLPPSEQAPYENKSKQKKRHSTLQRRKLQIQAWVCTRSAHTVALTGGSACEKVSASVSHQEGVLINSSWTTRHYPNSPAISCPVQRAPAFRLLLRVGLYKNGRGALPCSLPVPGDAISLRCSTLVGARGDTNIRE